MESLQNETQVNRIKIGENSETLDKLDKAATRFRITIDQKLNNLTPLPVFYEEIKKTGDITRRFNYCCKDLDNKIKTTDRYIDQFLPFRMIKEVSSFMEFLLPEE